MILVDFSQLCHRILHVTILMNNIKPKKDSKIKLFESKEHRSTFLHLLFSNIRYSKREFSNTYGETVIAIDSRSNWRKKVYPKYKEKRKKDREESDIDFEDFFKLMNYSKDVLKNYFPFKVIEVNEAEADDVIAILSNYNEKNIIISTDKDYKQLLKNKNIKLFNPIDKKFIELEDNELDDWILEHTIKGDESDGVPRIIDNTIFTDEFIKYLKDNDVYEYEVYNVLKLELGKKLIDDFEKKYDKSVYKKERFMYKKFIQDLDNNLNKNPLYKENLERNKILVLAENIPEYIKNKTIETFENTTYSFDPIAMLNFFEENKLKQLSNSIQDFYLTGSKVNLNISAEWEF